MGKSTTPTFRIEYSERGQERPNLVTTQNTMSWSSRQHGKPTAENLRIYVMKYAKSLEAGGCNEHISQALGRIPYPSAMWIIRQSNNSVVASWKAAMFQVW
jgi:hypothetical protein